MNSIGFLRSATDEQGNKVPKKVIVEENFTHALAVGQTGCGKTTSFIYPNLDKRIQLGHGILLYDYKGIEHLSVKYFAKLHNRLEDVVEIGNPWGESINILEGMTEADLDRFLNNSLGDNKDNTFWQNGSKSLAQAVLDLFRILEEFGASMDKIVNDFSHEERITIAFDHYSFKMNIENLLKVCSSLDNLREFTNSLDTIPKELRNIVKRYSKIYLAKRSNLTRVMQHFEELLALVEKSRKTVQKSKNALASYTDKENEHLSQQFMGSLVAPLATLSQNVYFNRGSFNIVEALNRGKIVVINTQALSDTVMASLNDVILNDLTMRTRRRKKHPVSVFIDEAQRVLTKSTDLPIDVLREAKVELFLATQNSSLLKNKLENDKFNSMMGNLSTKFYYKNFNEESHPNPEYLMELEKFEYVCSTDGFRRKNMGKPYRLCEKTKLKVEYMYQQSRNVLPQFAAAFRDKAVVLEYVPKLFEKNRIIAVSLRSGKEYIVPVKSEKERERLQMEVKRLFETASRR